MANITAYLAQPIDFGSADEGLVKFATARMGEMGWTVYDPFSAFASVASEPDDAINLINEAAMNVASVAVAFLPADAKTIGVPAEIGHLLAKGTPTLIVTDLTSSWVVAGWSKHPNACVVEMDEQSVASGLAWVLGAAAHASKTSNTKGIVFEPKTDDAQLPIKGYADDAGYDLFTSKTTVVPARGFADIPCGVAVDLPDHTWGLITGRSSTLRKRRLLVSQGVIDAGYTGLLFAGCENVTDEDVVIKKGERVAQLILHVAEGQKYTPEWGTTRTKLRGSAGFGSTGTN